MISEAADGRTTVTFDPQAKAVYVEIVPNPHVHQTLCMTEGVNVDLAVDGTILGVEVLR